MGVVFGQQGDRNRLELSQAQAAPAWSVNSSELSR